jgi:hypothetical protein
MLSRPPTSGLAAKGALVLASLFGMACTGSVGSNGGGSGPGGGSNTPGGSNPGGGNPGGGPGGGSQTPTPMTPVAPPDRTNATGSCKNLDPGSSPLRLLTKREYANTVRDLLGDATPVLGDLQEDARPVRGFANDAISRSASDSIVAGFMKAAEKLATAAAANMGRLVDCNPSTQAAEGACLDKFLDGFGKRAWRRPLAGDERQNLIKAFNDNRGKSFAEGIEAVVTVMLMAPQFLYRYEQGAPITGSNFTQLSSYEVASRLSYLLWGSMPDSELMAAADGNKLQKTDEVMAHARRMTSDPRFVATVADFTEQYLNLDQMPTLDKDTMSLPTWKPELREAMRLETQKFFENVISKDGDGKLATFLTAPYSFMNKPLAAYHGVNGPAGDAFEKVNLDPNRAAGFLTQTGFLAVHGTPDDGLTSLVFRGIFVRENLLCQHIPDPPPNAQDENPPFTDTTTPREWAFARMAKPVCGSCHQTIDHIGFLFENWDPIGKWRTMDRGKPVDSSGMLDMSDVDGQFNSVPALAKKLAGSKMVSDCVATQWFRFAAGRADSPRDACSMGTLQDSFNKSGGDLRELFVSFAQTDAFLFRSKGDAP